MENERKRIRLRDYDYGEIGCYFITICADKRRPIFSRIIPGNAHTITEVRLSPIGSVIQKHIQCIPRLYPDITIDHYVIMPNHVHLLISVHKESRQEDRSKMLIPKIIQSLKASVTKEIPIAFRPVWQTRYYDHVIRDASDFQIKWQYIQNNPVKWVEDSYYLQDGESCR